MTAPEDQVWVGRDVYGRVVGVRDVTRRDAHGQPIYTLDMWVDHCTVWTLGARHETNQETP